MSSPFPALIETEPPRAAQGDRPAAGPIYRARYAPKGTPDLGLKNLRDNFEASVNKYPNRPCLGFRRVGEDGQAGPYEFLTYREVADNVAAVHGAYESLGLGPRDSVGIIGPNCMELMTALQALNRMNGVCVPLYDTLGDSAVEYIIKHAECKLIIAQGDKLGLVGRALAKGAKDTVKTGVVYWGKAAPDAIKSVTSQGLTVRSWDELLEAGRKNPVAARDAQPTDLCTIMYTSGTTGDPKGVMTTHEAVLSTVSGVIAFLDESKENFGPDDIYLSYLPMAHIFDRVVEEFMLHIGGSIGYWQGDIKKIMSDIDALKPTLFVGVPRVFERIVSGVEDQLKKAGWLKNAIFKYAYHRKLWYMQGGWRFDRASVISDVLVFNKLKAKLGGRVRVILSGGAPISAAIEEFLKVTMCAPVVQGYGLTETCAASFISYPYDYEQTGTVGPPMPHTELRLEAVPEMGYDPLASPPRGEVCIRSTGVFKGYYKNEDMTKQSIDKDGFFHTGDIGEIMPTGALKIIDRMKNLFKLSHGEYIAVERVENEYKSSPLVEQLWIYGNSFESFLVAVLVPKEQAVRDLAAGKGIDNAANRPLKELLSDSAVEQLVLSELKSTAKAAKLKGFEEIKAVKLESEPFSVENDLMTPSFKLKRAPLLKRYQKDVDRMYQQLKANPPGARG